MNRQTQKLSFREKFCYGFGDLASVLYWQTFMLYFTFFYTDVFMIPAAAAATMFLVSRIWDGVNDPLMGMIADRTQTRWGKFRPYLLWICVPFAVVGVLTFTVPNFGATGKLYWAYGTFILIMMLYTAINIPYTALLGVISADSNERTTVSSVKFLFAFSAGIIVSATLLPMTKQLGVDNESIIHAKIVDSTIQIEERGIGNANIVLYAEDENGIKNKTEFGFRVDPLKSNKPLVKKAINNIRLNSGFKARTIDISDAFDAKDKDKISYEIENSDTSVIGAKIENSELKITEKTVGIANLKLKAIDKEWGDSSQEFIISVSDTANSQPCLIDSTKEVKLLAGFNSHKIDLATIFEDKDGDNLTFEVSTSNKDVVSPEVKNNMLSFAEGSAGIANLTIIAKDGKGRYAEAIKQVVVANVANNPPYLSSMISNKIFFKGFNTYQIPISGVFTDLEGDDIKYSLKVIDTSKGWQSTFIIYGIAAVIFFLITFVGTRERVQPPKNQQSSIKKDLYELVTNKPWLILLATTITFILFVAVRSSVTVHYFKYVIGTQQLSLPFMKTGSYGFVELTSAFNTVGQISAFIGVLLVSWFAKLVGKKQAFIILFIVAIVSTAAFYFLSAAQLGLIFLFQITGSMTGGPLSVLLWAMYADTADYGEWKRGRRTTGLIFSASTMSQKFGWAFGAFVALNLMSQVGFVPNQAQSAESLKGLILLFSLIPAVLGVIALGILLFYKLDEKQMKEITADLLERRKASGEEGAIA